MTTHQISRRFSAEDSALLLIDHQVGTMQLIKNIDRNLAASVLSQKLLATFPRS